MFLKPFYALLGFSLFIKKMSGIFSGQGPQGGQYEEPQSPLEQKPDPMTLMRGYSPGSPNSNMAGKL
jgi:hypothetical protein